MNNGLWLRFKSWVQTLFGIRPQMPDEALATAEEDAKRYFDSTAENITAIVANTLATLALGDADVTISADDKYLESPRIKTLSELLAREMTESKRTISAGLGVGMVATIPYSASNGSVRKLYTATVTKDRFFITGMQGTDITACVVISDIFEDGTSTYMRWTDYSIEDGVYVIKNKATKDAREIPLTDVERWASIPEEVRIAGVDRLPIGIFRCPTANRRPNDVTGVPITFGCGATLQKIADTLADIETEYKRKRVKVFADRSLLKTQYDENGNPVKNSFDDDLYVKFGQSDTFNTEIFDPSIRDSAYFSKLQQHFAFLEKEIGCSRGILTDLSTSGATATEIRRSMYQTFCLLDDIHTEFEKYIRDVLYGLNVLCNFYGLDSDVPYAVRIDWSYALLEDTDSTWNQMLQAASLGAERTAELRMFLHPDEDLRAAQDVIDEIRESSLIANQILGMAGNEQPED